MTMLASATLSAERGTTLGAAAPPGHASLAELMHEGVYLIFLLRNGCEPIEFVSFSDRIDEFLKRFERDARKINASAEDIYLAKYVFCAFVDETILKSNFPIRDAWALSPLQLRYFGEHLAGENVFKKLEELRNQGSSRLQVLEVFHRCLLLGYEGKYVLEGREKLNFLVSRLGEEIAHHRGKRAAFAPHWKVPDQIKNIVKNEIPLWVWFVALLALAALFYFLFDWLLGKQAAQTLAGYTEVIKPLPKQANVIITLP
jgi:type VI secretion system protein ImpK